MQPELIQLPSVLAETLRRSLVDVAEAADRLEAARHRRAGWLELIQGMYPGCEVDEVAGQVVLPRKDEQV